MWSALLGQRVVVRRVAGAESGRPRYSDLIGHLESVTADRLVVRRADGSHTSVPTAEVHRIRPVPPRPLRVGREEVLALAEVTARGWRAPDTERFGGWLLRAAEGFTGRANSVLPVGDPPVPLPDALDRVADWYARRGLPARFQVPLPARADLDAALAAAGHAATDTTYVLTAGIPAALDRLGVTGHGATGNPGAAISLAAAPDPDWLAGYHYRGTTALPPVALAIMTGHPRVVFASARRDGVTVGVARAVVDDDWAGLTALEVPEPHRRQGLARRLVGATLGWARDLGAARVYLQVLAGNTPALALYDRLGFARHHTYHYRTRELTGE